MAPSNLALWTWGLDSVVHLGLCGALHSHERSVAVAVTDVAGHLAPNARHRTHKIRSSVRMAASSTLSPACTTNSCTSFGSILPAWRF